MYVKQKIVNARVKLREKINPIFGPFRRNKLNDQKFTIISNNCWAGHVYRYFDLPYNSPTIGLYFYSDDYIKFCKNLKYYLGLKLQFITVNDSKYKEDLVLHGNIHCPIGVLGDIEIVFLHYKSEDEALEKWNRRVARVNWNNLLFKMSEMNLCNYDDLVEFDKLECDRKIVFVVKDYGLQSQVIWKKKTNCDYIPIDTVEFRTYVDLIKWINGDSNFRL